MLQTWCLSRYLLLLLLHTKNIWHPSQLVLASDKKENCKTKKKKVLAKLFKIGFNLPKHEILTTY